MPEGSLGTPLSTLIDTNKQSFWFDFAKEQERHRPADALIRSIYSDKAAWSARRRACADKIRSCYGTLRDDPEASFAWQSLLNLATSEERFLTVEPVFPSIGPQPGNTYLDALLHLAMNYPRWVRPLETWQSDSTEPRERFSSLVRHLISNYFTPLFMDEAWFEGFSLEGESHREWFGHIGGGENIRTANLPMRFTKLAAHCFLQAPSGGSIVSALRYGQVLGLGGDAFLASAISESKLRTILPDEEFWESVIHFFVNQPNLDCNRVSPIVDFIYDRKFGDFPAPSEATFSDAIEPTFSMKGRKLDALQARVLEWHEALAREAKRGKANWEPSGFSPFVASEPDNQNRLTHWIIRELGDSFALQREGAEMRHCVFSYRAGCKSGKTSIWSVRARFDDTAQYQRLLTVEVDNLRRAIVQVKGKCNKSLSSFVGKERMKKAGEILRRWAREQKLSIVCSL